ncbi:hypothetical protein HDU93_009320 [Gonapodya sp. JEL0774]|nr:hypothetical protein HDU93_009320 [Gonapodya sp. JEL0774]
MPRNEIYISTDIESDGPIPGPNSMLSFGSAAYTPDKRLVSTFSANLELLPGAQGDPKTMAWWGTQPEAWAACRSNLEEPEVAMKRYKTWLKSLSGTPVFVAYPAGYDFLFVYWYLIRFTGDSPFSHSALDIKTYAMALLKGNYRDATKRHMPKKWFDPALAHTHVALDDAIEQGALFCNMLKQNLEGPTDRSVYNQDNSRVGPLGSAGTAGSAGSARSTALVPSAAPSAASPLSESTGQSPTGSGGSSSSTWAAKVKGR